MKARKAPRKREPKKPKRAGLISSRVTVMLEGGKQPATVLGLRGNTAVVRLKKGRKMTVPLKSVSPRETSKPTHQVPLPKEKKILRKQAAMRKAVTKADQKINPKARDRIVARSGFPGVTFRDLSRRVSRTYLRDIIKKWKRKQGR